MKKLLGIVALGLLLCGYANAKEKIYCLDLDNFGFDYIYVEQTIERQYHLVAYEAVDKNNSQKCKGNVPTSIKDHRFLKIDKNFYLENKLKSKDLFTTADPYASIPVNALREYFNKNNINIDLEKIVRDGKKDIANAEEFKPRKKSNESAKAPKESLCGNEIDFSWNKFETPGVATFEFKSSCDKGVHINNLIIYTKDGREMKRYTPPDGYLRPFGVKKLKMFIADLNQDLIKSASYNIKPGKPKKSNKVTKSNNSDKYDWVAYIVFAIVGFFILGGVLSVIDDGKKNKKTSTDTNQNNGSNKSFIETVWNGEETMSKTFWIYCIVLGVIVAGITGVLAGLYSNAFYILTGIYIFWSNIGLWNSSNKYRQAKLSLKQPYGWSTAAKVYVVFNFLTTLSQLGFILKGF